MRLLILFTVFSIFLLPAHGQESPADQSPQDPGDVPVQGSPTGNANEEGGATDADSGWIVDENPDQPTDGAADGDDWVSGEGRRRPTQTELTVARVQARLPNLAAKENALRLIGRIYDEGRLTAFDGETISVLEFLAEEGVRVGSGNFPTARRRAVELLAQVGGPEARQILLSVLNSDPEPMVLAEAVYGLGHMRAVPDTQLTAALTEIIRENNARHRDDSLAFYTLVAIEMIHEGTAGIRDPNLFYAIFDMAEAGYAEQVTDRVFHTLDLLRKVED